MVAGRRRGIMDRSWLRSFVLAAAMAIAAACTPDTADDVAPQETAPDDRGFAAATDLPELVREVAPQTVSVEITGADGLPGAGSGVIWSSEGVIVTNAHVVAVADQIAVVLADGSRFDAEVVAADVRTDVAVLRIDATGIPAATFSEVLPDIGEFALALGNPLGFQNTATAGIVAGVDRSLPVVPDMPPLVGLIQTDAAISSGSSGGALVGVDGEVIGINVAAIEGAQVPGVAQGLGFAIPSTTVVPVVEQLLEDGEVAHAFLGIAGVTLTPQLADRFELQAERGVLIGEVQPGGPADEAGLEQGEVVVGLDDQDVESLGDLLTILRRLAPGERVTVDVLRNGEQAMAEVTLDELPDEGLTEPPPAP